MHRPLTRISAPAAVVVAVGAAAVVILGAAIAVLTAATPAHAATVASVGVVSPPSPPSLSEVIDNIRNWLVGLLVALATLFLTIGGLRYLIAGGDPGEVAKAKDTLKYAALGYAVAVLAPVLASILKQIVGS